VVAGSDDGSFYIWEKSTTNIVRILRGDESIVNCLEPHPVTCLLATSGIDPYVRLWSPLPDVSQLEFYFLHLFIVCFCVSDRRGKLAPLSPFWYSTQCHSHTKIFMGTTFERIPAPLHLWSPSLAQSHPHATRCSYCWAVSANASQMQS